MPDPRCSTPQFRFLEISFELTLMLEGANELPNSFDDYEDEDITKVDWLRGSLEQLTERVEA